MGGAFASSPSSFSVKPASAKALMMVSSVVVSAAAAVSPAPIRRAHRVDVLFALSSSKNLV
jgi:hypothetical protein